jgi:putative Holliday junction resolvase
MCFDSQSPIAIFVDDLAYYAESKGTRTMEETGRLLGLDIGHRRIGVAVSDPLGMVASPWGYVAVGRDEGLPDVCALVTQLEVVRIIVGLPLAMDGQERDAAQGVRAWVERLCGQVSVPVELWDERLSTLAAERALLESGMRREKRKVRRDAVAAALILQSYLDARRVDW